MPNWWEHLDEKEYRKWRADEFATKARDEFARRRQPKPEPLPEPKEEGGGLLGGLKKLGGLALKPFEWEREHIAKPLAGLEEKVGILGRLPLPEEAKRGLRIGTALGSGGAGIPPLMREATKETPAAGFGELYGDVAYSPSTYVGLGAGAAITKTAGLTRLAPAIAGLEDIAIGGPVLRAGGRAVMAPFKAATRGLKEAATPQVVGGAWQRTGPEAAFEFRIRVFDEAVMRKRDAAAKNIIEALETSTKPARELQTPMTTATRGQRFARAEQVGEKGLTGPERFAAARGELAGEMPKATYEVKISGEDISHAYDTIWDAHIPFGDKLAAVDALNMTLGVEMRGGLVTLTRQGKAPGFKGIARLQKLFGTDFAKAAKDKWKWGERLEAVGQEIVGLPRAVLASIDRSAPLRQGLVLGARRPMEWLKAGKRATPWMFDPEYAVRRATYLRTNRSFHPEWPEAVELAGLKVPKPGGIVGQTEEMFGSRLAQEIPGIPMSERIYVGDLAELRTGVFRSDLLAYEKHVLSTEGRALNLTGTPKLKPGERVTEEMAAQAQRHFAKDAAAMRTMGDTINATSGAANLPAFLEKVEGPLSFLLFAPRLLWSRLVTPAMALNVKNPYMWKMAAGGLASAAAANVAFLSMIKLSGGDVETSPLSTDFGKGRVGNTRIDLFGGYQPIMRYSAQLIMQQRKTTVAGEHYAVNPKDTVFQFLRTKLAPAVGIGVDWATGETMLGDPISGEMIMKESEFGEYVEQRLTPMFIQDMKDAIEQQGLKGAFLAAPGGFGASVMSYSWPSQRLDELAQKVMNQRWKDLNTKERREFLSKSPEAKKVYDEYIEIGIRRGQDWAEGIWETMESNKELQARLVGALDAGAPKAEVAADFTYYRSSEAYEGDEEREPRDEQEALMMGYFAIKPEDHRRPDGTTDFGAMYDARRQYIEDNNQTQEFFNENELLKWDDPTMQGFVGEWQWANDLWAEYYDIPSKLGMSPEDQKEARGVLAQVTTLQFMQPGLSTRQALIQLDIPSRLKFLALRYGRLRSNPEREVFRTKYGTDMALIKPPEFGAAVTEEVAR